MIKDDEKYIPIGTPFLRAPEWELEDFPWD